jgi:hypothetical protein
MTIQASAAGSNPASGVIFVAINTSNDVAELRTLPEMVSSVAETTGCCSASESRRSLTLWKVRPRTCIACDGIADVGRLNGCLRGFAWLQNFRWLVVRCERSAENFPGILLRRFRF